MGDDNSRATARLWRVYRTVHEMLADRGYTVAPEQSEMSLADFAVEYSSGGVIDRKGLSFLVSDESGEQEPLFVCFPEDSSVGLKTFRDISNKIIQQSVYKAIIVYEKSVTPSARKFVSELPPKYQIEIFQETDLLVNITKHVLVPKHEVLSVDEKKTLLQRYRLRETQLPRIHSTDPIARYYGMKRGQVVKIIRPSETAGKYVTYRLCF